MILCPSFVKPRCSALKPIVESNVLCTVQTLSTLRLLRYVPGTCPKSAKPRTLSVSRLNLHQ